MFLKIMLWLLFIIIALFFSAVSYAAGITRGFKIMTSKQKLNDFEKNVVKKLFNGLNVNPYFYKEFYKKLVEDEKARRQKSEGEN